MATLSTPLQTKEVSRFIRFSVVGTLGTLLDVGVLTLLKMAGFSTLFANTISFSIGLIHNFSLNRLWTFDLPEDTHWQDQFIRYASVSLIGLTLNNIILLSLESHFITQLNQPEWGYLPAKAIATSVVVFWNYFANKYWTFR